MAAPPHWAPLANKHSPQHRKWMISLRDTDEPEIRRTANRRHAGRLAMLLEGRSARRSRATRQTDDQGKTPVEEGMWWCTRERLCEEHQWQ